MATITKITNPTNPWRVQIRRTGQPTISKCFPTNAEAKRWARAEEAKLDKDPTANTGAKLTVAELIESYVKKYIDESLIKKLQKERATREDPKRQLKDMLRLIKKHLGHLRLNELTMKQLESYAEIPRVRRRSLKASADEPLAGGYLTQRLNTLKMLLYYGGALEGAEGPCSSAILKLNAVIKDLRTRKKLILNERNRRPTISELEKLDAYFAALPYNSNPRLPMWDLILFAMSTCMRRGEITKIVWEDFNPIDRTIWIMDRKDPSGKHERNDEVPLLRGTFNWRGEPVDPIAIMMRQRSSEARTGRIFPHVKKHISKVFKQACDACGIEDLHFHDLRHEGVSRLFEDKRPMEEVSVVSGHRSWENLKRYTNLKPKNLHRDQITAGS